MKKRLLAIFLSFQIVACAAISNVIPVGAAATSVDVTIDTSMERTSISPYIYGVNQDHQGETVTARRLGGNRMTGYNWETNASNAGHDYIHASDDYMLGNVGVPIADYDKPGAVASVFHDKSIANNVPYTLLTLQAAGYVSADKNGEVKETETAPSARWKEVKYAKNSPFSLTPDLTDNYVYMDEFVNFLVNKYGSASTETGIKGYAIDNEPGLWSSTHPRIHPENAKCSEVVDRGEALSKAIKNVDPDAEVFGPQLYGFNAYISLQDAPDWKGNLDASYNWFVDYYLDQMKKKSDAAGQRLLDVFTVHYYPEARGGGKRIVFGEDSSNIECNKARLQAPRTLWDTTYTEDSWITESWTAKYRPIIPKLKESIDNYNPGTKLGITEYDFGAGDHITGGIAEADVLGLFGKYGLYLATYWGGGDNKDYIVSGLNLYTNYDGNGSKYGDTNVKCLVSDNETASAYSSIVGSDDGKLHMILLNKNYDSSVTFNVSISGSKQYKSGKVWGFDRASSNITERAAVTGISNNQFTYTLPALSAYHIVLDTEGNPSDIIYGDLNGDTNVNSIDFALFRMYLLDMPCEIKMDAADVNLDGGVNSIDFAYLRQYLLDMITSLPVGSVNPGENKPPVTAFTASLDAAVTDEDVTFDASGSSDPDGSISYYVWDFGDGTEGSGEVVKHKFAKAGTYIVKLVVTDNKGTNSTPVTKSISVTTATGDNSDFGFEGTVEGFTVAGFDGSTAEVSATTSKAFKGTGAIKVDISSVDGGMVDVKIDGPAIVPAGSKVAFRVWIPSGAPLTEIQGYVMPHDPAWDIVLWNGAWGGYTYMKKDAWNELTLTLPEDIDMTLMQQVGVQFKTNGAADFSVYIDSIDW